MLITSRIQRVQKRRPKRSLVIESLEGRRLLSGNGNDHDALMIEAAPLPRNLGEPDDAFAALIDASFESGEIPLLHSLPEATNKIFLDFDGNYEQSWSDNENVVTPPYDIDGDSDVFSGQELQRIFEIWQRVAEDYSPFNIDVTTEDPADHVTELREVDDSIQRIRTFYFRREFEINDPAAIRNLQVHLLRDDGAAVYLNGTEVVRDQLSAGARHTSFATSGASGANERTFHQFNVNSDLLVRGRNVISVEVHQRSDNSSDTSFDLRLNATVSGQQNVDVIPQSSDWKYLDDGSDQGVAWRASDFDDSTWPTGIAEFGYGDVVATTHVAIGGSSADWFDGSSGGVAFLSGFNRTGVTTAYVFARSIGNGAKNIAEAASHEAGHTFGLFHQGLYDNDTGRLIDEYNPGADGWAPIMGVGYDELLTTWHDGPTSSVDTFQDNMSVLSRNAGGYRADDHGNSSADATSIMEHLDGGFFAIDGIVGRNSDRDVFQFVIEDAQAGVSISVDGIGIAVGQNLDAVLELRNADDEIIQRVDPEAAYDASLAVELDPGVYTVSVQGNGEYGRVGQYTLSGHIDEKNEIITGFARLNPLGSGGLLKHLSGAIDFEGDADQFIIAGQSGQMFSWIVTPLNPSAVLSVDVPQLDQFAIANAPGQAIGMPPVLLNGDDLILEISSNVPSEYAVEFYVNATAELSSDFVRGSSVASPSQFDIWQTHGGLQANVVGTSSDGTDTQYAVVSRGATWRYLDDGSNQRSAWQDAAYDDASWLNGAGHFGYGDGDETIFLNELRDNGSRIRTFYFRHKFDIADPAAIHDLTLRLVRDDGAAVYLNGTEVRRDNLATIASYNSLAGRAEIENDFVDSLIDPRLLVPGENILAVEVHQASDSSSDLSFELELLANAVPQRPATELIAAESAWRYLDDGSNQQTAWQKSGYDDESWKSGNAKLGYGDDDEATRLSRNDASGQRIRTFYFRKEFEVGDLSQIDELIAGVNFDDGVAIYLNGMEVARDNLAAKADYRTLADESRRPEGVFDEFTIDASLITLGTNVIAVEVHQTTDTSSDVAFDMYLTGYQDAVEIDVYQFDVSDFLTGAAFDISLFGDAGFSAESLTLIDPDGQIVSQAVAVDGDALLAMREVQLDLPGTYSLRLESETSGDYQISISAGFWPDYRLGDGGIPLLHLDNPSVGYVGPMNLSDTYEFNVTAAGEYAFALEYPFSDLSRSTENSLNATIIVFNSDGELIGASNDERLNLSLRRGTYQVEVLRSSGLGEYDLHAVSQTAIPASADLNDDRAVNSHDIDHLCNAIRNRDVELDQNSDGVMNLADLENFVLQTLKTKFGDANLDGVFNSTDFVFVFSAAEYEDDFEDNSVWADGDWNCDGDFDTQDFVTAFTYGGYSAAARQAVRPAVEHLRESEFGAAYVPNESDVSNRGLKNRKPVDAVYWQVPKRRLREIELR